jgi:hypothetical protein
MGEFDQPEEFRDAARRVREEREQWSAEELDRIKLRAMAKAGDAGGRSRSRRGMPMRSRALVLALSALMVGGTVAGGIAATSDSGKQDAANQQYGPPDTCPNGNPKPPDGNCGNRPETCPNGNPKPPGGNCGRNPRDEANKCKEKLQKDRAALKKAKARHRKFAARYRGAKRQRLEKKFKAQERKANSRATRKYRNCRNKAAQP